MELVPQWGRPRVSGGATFAVIQGDAMSTRHPDVLHRLYLTLVVPLAAVGVVGPLSFLVLEGHHEVLRRRAKACLEQMEVRTGPEVD